VFKALSLFRPTMPGGFPRINPLNPFWQFRISGLSNRHDHRRNRPPRIACGARFRRKMVFVNAVT
jgi:hypothetical protein